MKTILFVDDERKVLNGLKRLLAVHAEKWDMRFAASGAEGLEVLSTVDVDVLVVDLLMPGVTGLDLLEDVAERWPDVMRVVLSGYSDKEMIMRSVPLAHRFLAKPCEPDLLEAVLEQLTDCARLASTEMCRWVNAMTVLPVVPELKAALDLELGRDEPSPHRLAALVSTDVALAAKCMNLVNSSFFQPGGPVLSLELGVGMLGLEVLRSLCLSMDVFTGYEESRHPGFSLKKLWEHSRRVARLARTLAVDDKGAEAFVGEVYTCALLHDVGKLVEAQGMPHGFASAVALARERGRGLDDAEHAVLGIGHAGLGAHLLRAWGLPDTVVAAVADHHRPPSHGQAPPHLPYVCAANMLDHECLRITPDHRPRPLDEAPFRDWGLADRLPRWREIARGMSGADA